MKSKTTLEKQLKGKTHPSIVRTIILAKKEKAWFELASRLSGPTRSHTSINLDEIDSQSKEGDTLIVAGKVLGTGNVHKRLRVCALSFSEQAKTKLKAAKAEAVILEHEIKHNPKAQGIKFVQ